MSKPSKIVRSFGAVCVRATDVVAIASESESLTEEGTDHTILFVWSPSQWLQKSWDANTVSLVSMDSKKAKLLAVCADGFVQVMAFPGFAEEHVDNSDDGPSPMVPLRAARLIGNSVYAVGMARMAYKRDKAGAWNCIDDGARVPRAKKAKVAGFLAVDGPSESSVFAAGYNGEIWHYDGKRWKQEVSPANVALTTMRCSPKGDIVIAGMAGTVIKGSKGKWASIPNHLTEDDFWGSTYFKGHFYLATDAGIYRLTDDSLEQVKVTTAKKHPTTYALDANDEVMWSVGDKHLMKTNDGVNWQSVAGPV